MSKKHHYKSSFFKLHSDAIAIIGVNLAIAGLLISMIISNSHRIDAANTRSDLLHSEFVNLLKDLRNKK